MTAPFLQGAAPLAHSISPRFVALFQIALLSVAHEKAERNSVDKAES